ncbi:MAG: ester cyclase [Pseudomonadota bacterium]|nr:ester cyclase [Pseudomonadota bacterium]
MSEFNKQLVKHAVQLSWNTGRFNLLKHLICPDFVYHTSFAEGFMDFDGFAAYISKIRHAIPDLEVSIEEIMAEGDKVISVSTFSGTFEHEVFGYQPNQRIISFGGVSTWTIRRGKIASQNTLVDISELQRQLASSKERISMAV